MDFLTKNKTFIGLTALASLLGAAIYFGRRNSEKEAVLSEVLYEADLQGLKVDYASKIEQVKTEIREGETSEEKIAEVANHIAVYLEQWVRQAEREDLMKASETARTQSFSIYVEMALMWLKDDQSTANQLKQEKQRLFAGFSPEQSKRIQQRINQIERSHIDDYHRRLAVLSLTTRAGILRKEGKQLSSQLVQICTTWDQSDRTYLPSIINLILTQRTCDLQPALADSHLEIANAYDCYSAELQTELQHFQTALRLFFADIESILPHRQSAEIE